MYTESKVKELREDLYYDLLDKFVQLKAENTRIKSENKQFKHQLGEYRKFCEKDASKIEKMGNSQLDLIIKILYHNKAGRESINAVKALKFQETEAFG